MSLTLSQKPFGKYTLYTLGVSDLQVSFVPERSGYIHQVLINGNELLWNYASASELEANSWYRNVALLPFPNRMLNGQYEWDSLLYSFEINNRDTQSALHGFGPTVPFSIERVDISADWANVKMTFLHRPDLSPESYPFLVKFELNLKVDLQQRSVTWSLGAENLGASSVPVGLGWHPYFKLPGGYEQWKVQMPANKHVALEKAIPTGEFTQGLPSEKDDVVPVNTQWDDCFKLTEQKDFEVQLKGPSYSLSLKQEGNTRYTQLFVPPVETDCLAVEPMSCNVNAFNTSKEEVLLSSKQKMAIGMTISQL